MARTSKSINLTFTKSEAEKIMAEYISADTEIEAINAQIDEEIANIRNKYAGKIAEAEASKNVAFAKLQQYALQIKDTELISKKSMKLNGGIFGFRTTTPKLVFNEGIDQDDVISYLIENCPEYISTIAVLAKAKLIADRDNAKAIEIMSKIGVSIMQNETFFVKH